MFGRRQLIAVTTAAIAVGVIAATPAQSSEPLVFAAASLTAAVEDVATRYVVETGSSAPRLSFAASSTLAKQISAGAPAGVFLSANTAWVDHLDEAGLVEPGSRVNLLGNRLVLIAPVNSPTAYSFAAGGSLAQRLADGRLALGDPDHTPAGIYAKLALAELDLWSDVETRLAPAPNVRVALALVERGEAPLGIVYKTDAESVDGVRIVDAVPDNSHPPISYVLVLVRGQADAGARQFYSFLSGPEAAAVFSDHGFVVTSGVGDADAS